MAFDEPATTNRVMTMEIGEQLARQRALVAPALRTEIKRRAAEISRWLDGVCLSSSHFSN
jgi:hypothetical protein